MKMPEGNMASSEKFHPLFVIDDTGKLTHSILPISEYLDLIEDAENIEDYIEREQDPSFIPFEDVKAQLDL